MTETPRGLGPHLDDDTMSAAVDGEASAAELAHLASCPQCQGRVAQLSAVARAVGTPVRPRKAADVTAALDTALHAALAAAGPRRHATDARRDEPASAVTPAAVSGPRAPATTPARSGAGRRAAARWAGAAAAVAAATVVVVGVVNLTRVQHGASVSTSRQFPTSGAAAPRSERDVNGFAAPGGIDLGDQSDPAQVASAVTSRLAASAGAAPAVRPPPAVPAPPAVPSLPAASSTLTPAPKSLPPPGLCFAQAMVAVGLAPDPSVMPRFTASLRWRGEPAVVLVYATPTAPPTATPTGLSGVIMRSADCGRLALLPL